jgi:arsenate reductase (glutaredoxin)
MTVTYAASMAAVTIYHNPNCSSSVTAVRMAEEMGVDADVVLYLKTPPDEATLRTIAAKLDGPVTEMVRRDSLWKKLGLTDADAETPDQVVALLVRNKALLQRPLLVTGKSAVVGRPKERIREILERL